MLVGGFGASDLLRERVQRAVDGFKGCTLITPMRPAIAVEYGAVLFGLTQASFASRISRFTYGVSSAQQYNRSNVKHTSADTVMYDSVPYVSNIFTKFVKAGESVACDSVVTQCVSVVQLRSLTAWMMGVWHIDFQFSACAGASSWQRVFSDDRRPAESRLHGVQINFC